MYMRNPAVQTLGWAVMSLMLGALVAGLVACGDSATPTSRIEPGPEPLRPLGATDRGSPATAGATPRETVMPTAGSVSLSSIVVTPMQESRDERQVNPATPASTSTAGDGISSGAAVLTSGQIVAAFEEVLYEIYEKTIPSVVYLRVESPASATLRGVPGIPEDLLWSAGSGFVWDDEGHIVTNHHVVEEVIGRPEGVTVFFADSSRAKATVVGSDPHSDIAVIQLEEGDWELQPATLGDSSKVRVGQLSVALGAPFGQEFTMTSGIVSAVGRDISGQAQFSIPEVIQTDSAINPGNSGGPLLNRLGQVIGINTQIISRTGNFSGVGMAVPVNIAKRVVPPLIENGEFNYPWLGVRIATVDSAYAEELGLPEGSTGVLIIDIVNDSPAHRAELRAFEPTVEIDGVEFPAGGDIITAICAHRVAVASELIAHLTYHNSPGDDVTFTVLRDGEETEVVVTLGKRPKPLD